MKYKKTDSGITKILSSLIMIMLVVFAVGFLYYSTNSFSAPIQTFYVKCEEGLIKDTAKLDIVLNKEYKFEVFDVVSSVKGEKAKYSANVKFNQAIDSTFDYKVGGENYCSSYFNSNLNKGFEITKNDGYFTFKADKDIDDILSLYYQNQFISSCPSAVDTDISYFILEIISANGSDTINIEFKLLSE